MTNEQLKRILKPIVMEVRQQLKEESEKKYVIKKGGYIGGWTSNGEHYVIVDDKEWVLYTGAGKKLTSGKVLYQGDVDYIKKLSTEE